MTHIRPALEGRPTKKPLDKHTLREIAKLLKTHEESSKHWRSLLVNDGGSGPATDMRFGELSALILMQEGADLVVSDLRETLLRMARSK